MQIKEEKALLRKKYRVIRAEAKSSEKDRIIYERLIGSDVYRSSETVFVYCSIKSEADTLKIINTALADGKRVALPKCMDSSGNMEFYFIEAVCDLLDNGYFGLKEPDTASCERASFGERDICIVPALAADECGYRLGYGGGYYDRFLSKFKGRTVVLCYSECLCDMLPHDEYDVRLGYIVTDRKIYEIK